MKQSKTEEGDTLIHGMHLLDCVGSNPYTRLRGQDLSQRLFEIMKCAIELYGQDALLARFHDTLDDETLPHERLRTALKHVNRYAKYAPLGSRLQSSGILRLYLQASRRQKADGQWELDDARALCSLAR